MPNLPVQRTTLLGREQDIAALCEHVLQRGARLVTLTGPGGVGKTRLALAAGDTLASRFADGARWASLASMSSAELVPSAIANALDIEPGLRSPHAVVCDYLRDRQLLLLLDNLEHLPDVAPLVVELLQAAPRVVILATSRAPLHVAGEREFSVQPLALPDMATLDAVARASASALFVERARVVRPDFVLSDSSAAAVAALCRRLDGLPLAIELAAARARLLTPQAMLARLSNRLDTLGSLTEDRPARHQTLRATIGWSYDLLDEREQALLRALGVFAGGCTLEAIEALDAIPDPTRIFAGVTALIDHSLLEEEAWSDIDLRVGMLETIREFAIEQLAACGEREWMRERHAAYFLALAERAEPELRGPEQGVWLARLEADHDNLRAALGWLDEHGDVERALRLATALARFWETHGHLIEGLGRLERLLAATERADVADLVRANALNAVGNLRLSKGDARSAAAAYTAGLALFRAAGDTDGMRKILNNLGGAALGQGDYDRAIDMFQESLALARLSGNEWAAAITVGNLGELEALRGNYPRAAELHAECLELCRRVGHHRGTAITILNLADIARLQGQHERALTLYLESLTLLHELGDTPQAIICLDGVARTWAATGATARAARLFGAVERHRDAFGAPLLPVNRADYEQAVAAAWHVLGPERFAKLWAEGRALSLDAALAAATTPEPAALASLTARQRDVLRLVAEGRSNKEIAVALGLSYRTVTTHVDHIMTRLDLPSRAAVAAWATRHDLD